MSQTVQCACPSCHCCVAVEEAVASRDRLYCSTICAYECTETTCLCIHEHCDDDQSDREPDRR